jgi:hypothetical protein
MDRPTMRKISTIRAKYFSETINQLRDHPVAGFKNGQNVQRRFPR